MVNQGRGFASLFQLSTSSSFSVRDATAPAMLPYYHTPRTRPLIRKFSPSDFRPVRAAGEFNVIMTSFGLRPVHQESQPVTVSESVSEGTRQ